jgi:hypothetical protein
LLARYDQLTLSERGVDQYHALAAYMARLMRRQNQYTG